MKASKELARTGNRRVSWTEETAQVVIQIQGGPGVLGNSNQFSVAGASQARR